MESVSKFGAHVVSYLMSGLAIVAGLDPSLLMAYPKAAAAVGVAGLVLTGIHNVQAAGKPVAGVVKMVLAVLFVGALTATMAACTTAPTAKEQSAVTVGVYIVSGRTIKREDSDPLVWKARAEQYKAAAVKLQVRNDSGTGTIATLAADLSPLLDKLNPTDRLAADALIAALTPYLQEQADANPIVGYSQERLSVILAAFIRSCDAYIGAPSP